MPVRLCTLRKLPVAHRRLLAGILRASVGHPADADADQLPGWRMAQVRMVLERFCADGRGAQPAGFSPSARRSASTSFECDAGSTFP